MSDYIIGLTGGIGSGKTTIANMFSSLGIELVDADIVARQVVEPNSLALTSITKRFGDTFLLENGELNRSKLRELVFANESDKQWLNSLLHPLIRETIFEQLTQATSPYVLLVAPLLIENNLNQHVARTLVVDVDEETQIQRTLLRDNSSPKTIKRIIASQIARNKRLASADDVLSNMGSDLSKVQKDVLNLHNKYLALAKGKA